MKKEKIPFPSYTFETGNISKEQKDLIRSKKKEGDDFQMQQLYLEAIEKYKEAWELLPEPKYQWKYVFVLLESIAENYRLQGVFHNGIGGGFPEALEIWKKILNIENQFQDAYNHVQIGKLYHNWNNLDRAIHEFILAYVLEDDKPTIQMQLGEDFFSLIEPIIQDEKKISNYLIDEEHYSLD